MNIQKKIILTGDRPTGKLHLGHYVGSLRSRVELQNSGEYETFIMVADMQALTDNAHNPAKIRENLLKVALDYLAVGIDPAKSTIFVQSQVPALAELTMYYMNLVSLSRVLRNPTVKTEIKQKGWDINEDSEHSFINAIGDNLGDNAYLMNKNLNEMNGEEQNIMLEALMNTEYNDNKAGVPAGFAMYPISQAADITAFRATHVPVGADQAPMIEQTREIVRAVNNIYGGGILVEPEGIFPSDELSRRLPGIDGNAKMSKSLGNGIYLSDDEKTLHDKVFSMYTDPQHIKVSDPGHIDGNIVFEYLDVFAPMTAEAGQNLNRVANLKVAYQKGGLGDVTTKQFLFEILDEILTPIRQKRAELAKDPTKVYEILRNGNERANLVANKTLNDLKNAIFSDKYLG